MHQQPDVSEPTTDRVLHLTGLTLGHAVDHHIIRKTFELNTRELPNHPHVEAVMKENVGDQR